MFSTKHNLSILSVFAISAFAGSAFAEDVPGADGVKDVTFGGGKSYIKFVSTAPAEVIKGTSPDIKGQVKFNMDALEETTGELSVEVKTLDTGNKMRDRHLAGKDWLNAKKNPKITFTIEGLKNIKQTEATKKKTVYTATTVGKITVNGVAKATEAPVTITIGAGGGKIKVEPKFIVKLADHNVAGKKGAVGDKVGEKIDIEGLVYGKAK